MKTFDEWAAEGFRIHKGERSTKRDESGRPIFSAAQVYFPGAGRFMTARPPGLRPLHRDDHGDRNLGDPCFGLDAYYQDECDARGES